MGQVPVSSSMKLKLKKERAVLTEPMQFIVFFFGELRAFERLRSIEWLSWNFIHVSGRFEEIF